LKDGSIEGQQSSMVVQNIWFQAVVNTEVDQLTNDGDVDEALEVQQGIDLYADDSLSLSEAIGPRKDVLTRGQFKLEYETDPTSVCYIGVEIHKCTQCTFGVETRPSMSKHGGNLFHPNMLDSWKEDNAPSSSKLGLITSSLTRVYRHSSTPYPFFRGIIELLNQARNREFPIPRVTHLVRTVAHKLATEEPRPETPTATIQQQNQFCQYIIAGTKAITKNYEQKKGSRTAKRNLSRINARLHQLKDIRECAQCYANNIERCDRALGLES